MKTLKIFIMLMVQSALIFAQSDKGSGFILSGTVKGIDDGVVEMSSYNTRDRAIVKLNSAKIIKGKFAMNGKLPTAQLVTLSFPGNWSVQIFLENSNTKFLADTAGSSHFDYTVYGGKKGAVIEQAEVIGSPSHLDYLAYKLSTEGVKIRKELADRKMNHLKSFVNNNPEAVVGVYMLSDYYMYDSGLPLAELEAFLSKFSGDAKKTRYFSDLQAEVVERKAVLPGNMAEDFTLMKPDSTKFTLSSTRGKVVMIDFWASWCKPCRVAIPHWKNVYEKYKDKGFEIVSVTNDVKWTEWKKAMEVEQMPWVQVADDFPVKNMPAKVLSKYKRSSIPLYVLLDQTGKILAVTSSEAEIDRRLLEIFKI